MKKYIKNVYAIANSSTNLIQAQHDYFGVYTCQRIDGSSGKFYNTNGKKVVNKKR